MTAAIRFLETLGSHPALVQPGAAACEAALAALCVDGREQQALRDRDVQALGRLLGGRAAMAMAIATPDGGEEPLEAPGRDDDGQAEPEELPGEGNRPD